MVRMGDGSLARACPSFRTDFDPNPEKKMLVVIQHWDGDVDRAEQLAELISDLEPKKNLTADVMLFSRNDCRSMNIGVVERLRAKFGTVIVQRCSRVGSTGYPFGANEMFYDLAGTMASPKMAGRYYAWINLESDCTPTHPGWIEELSEAFLAAKAVGKHAVGHQCLTHPHPHLNGVAVYSSNWATILGGIIGGPANLAYDIHLGTPSVAASKDTPLIFLDFKKETITPDELFAPRKEGRTPALYHGVKDDSAIKAVRAVYLTAGPVSKSVDTRTPVYTFFSPVQELNQSEHLRQVDIWKNSWRSRGFKPVVLDLNTAMKHPDFKKLNAIFEKFPTVNAKKYELYCYLRWLALEVVGGGMTSDYDVVNNGFTPDDLKEFQSDENRITVFQASPDLSCITPAAVYAPIPALKKFIAALAEYKVEESDKEGENPHISDQNILRKHRDADWVSIQLLCKEYKEEGWDGVPMTHISTGSLVRERGDKIPKSTVMIEVMKR